MTAQANTEAAKQDAEAWSQLPLWRDKDWLRLRGNLPECWRCSAAFTPESSPSEEYCWTCFEELEAEQSC